MIRLNCDLSRLALIGALVAALGLAGCGRKGQLDPPPAASAAGAQAGAPAGAAVDGPVAPPGPKKRIPLDALLN